MFLQAAAAIQSNGMQAAGYVTTCRLLAWASAASAAAPVLPPCAAGRVLLPMCCCLLTSRSYEYINIDGGWWQVCAHELLGCSRAAGLGHRQH